MPVRIESARLPSCSARHFEAGEEDVLAGLGRCQGNPERHAGLAHARAPADHDHVGRLEPAEAVLYGRDAHREPQERAISLVGFLDAGSGPARGVADRAAL